MIFTRTRLTGNNFYAIRKRSVLKIKKKLLESKIMKFVAKFLVIL